MAPAEAGEAGEVAVDGNELAAVLEGVAPAPCSSY